MSSKQGVPEADPDEKLEALAADQTPGAAAAQIREMARLQLDNKALKKRNLRVWSAFIVLSGLFVFALVAWLYLFPKYRYIPTTDNRAICEVSTENNPRITPGTLTEYAKDAVVNSYTYDYVNYREALNEAANRWYTQEGRRAFMNSLDSSGNLERVRRGRLILRAMTTRVPQLEEEGRRGAQRYWVVMIPIAIEFYSGGEPQPRSRQDFIASVTIVQTPPTATNLKGIAVDAVSLKPYITRR
ncbi:DotI/IcmL family type IV secretion protein [Xanthomonas vasicola]|uniref:DotI/IcmL family type IV secretion protein n=1 Tax=Xanthomonas vasicola TaxID=56459 RepID=UPI001C47D6C0|nr:DotI/IcmL family type IV secretion protein [Xanthomonas vasicola]MBV6747189.1 DotI/IcmL family type IV secretion protein [Xanthomonas vasicola pv. vasculorum NCPPB 890]MBV6892740.1 DotI/IcmL family type IV secretion protein [Xanthomonas vasicola pv. vasculorum]MDO6948472.1 DotI/IcmL family type IV secretion protein [Xanthomonas vasicola]MDO6960490.1 DotI/IcmL family type IV secretion protein [Xanthomonas vasicola]